MNEYHKDTTRISKSGLDLIRKAPALYKHRYIDGNGDNDSKPFLLGRAFHDIILQPELFKKQFVIKPNFSGLGSRTEYEKWDQLHTHRDILKFNEHETIIGMQNAVKNNAKASKLLSAGIAEKIFFFTDPMTGVKCKIRPDFISDLGYVVDLKSTDDASNYGMAKSIRKFRYHVQSAFYQDGLERNNVNVKGFIFIFVEKHPPYLVNMCVLSAESIEKGRDEYQDDLYTYMKCLESGIWGGYGDDIKEIDLNY